MTFVDSRLAWMLAISGCLLMFVSSGNIRTNGVLFVALMRDENLNRGTASWPFNLPGVSTIIAAPLTAYMIVRYSATTVSLLASVVFVLGQLPCYFSTDIYTMSIFYGILRGFGVSMHSTLIPLLTSTSFKLYRSTAMGLCMTGSPLGGIVMPLLAQFLVLEYDLKGTILVLTGVSLHTFVFSLLYMWYDNRGQSKEPSKKVVVKDDNERTPLISSAQKRYDEKVHNQGHPSTASNVTGADDKESLIDVIKEQEQEVVIYEVGSEGTRPDDSKSLSSEKVKQTPTSDDTNVQDSKPTTRVILMKIFTNRGFLFTTANQMVGAISNYVFSQVIIDYAMDKGIPELLGVYLVTCSSAGDIIGKLCLGIIPDKGVLSIYNHVALFQMISAGMAVLLPFSNNLYILLVISFAFGMTQGTCLSSNFVQLVDYVSKDELPLAMSVLKLLAGIAFFMIPGLIGLFRDTLGSYDELFYLLAAGQLVFTFVWLFEGFIVHRRKKTEKNLA